MTAGIYDTTAPLGDKPVPTLTAVAETVSEFREPRGFNQARGNFYQQVANLQSTDPLPAATRFDQEIRQARKSFRRLHESTRSIMDQLERSTQINLAPLDQLSEEFVASFQRNPDAMLYVVRTDTQQDLLVNFSFRMAGWAALLGRHLNLSAFALKLLTLAALFCKTGYQSTPHEILNAKNAPDSQVQELLKWTLIKGMDTLRKAMPHNGQIINIIGNHQERCDGSGFPRGLKGGDIPILSQILGMCDYFEALVSDDFRDRAMTAPEAIRELYNQRTRQFDPELVEVFIQAIGLYPTGSLVRLNGDRLAIVVGQTDRRLQPKVLVLSSPKKSWQLFRRKTLNLKHCASENFIVSSVAMPSAQEIPWNGESLNKISRI